MPNWVLNAETGKPDNWGGGRYYVDQEGNEVFFIEKMRGGVRYNIRLRAEAWKVAKNELTLFDRDPVKFAKEYVAQPEEEVTGPVYITTDLLNRYLEHLKARVVPHREAVRSQLLGWSELGMDLRQGPDGFEKALAKKFKTGHQGRRKALNAFCNWLVEHERVLDSWRIIQCAIPARKTKKDAVAYSIEELIECFKQLEGGVQDVFLIRAQTGLHHTEVEQLAGCPITKAPLPNRAVPMIRELDGAQKIAGVLQMQHKSRRQHRQSVTKEVLEAALRIQKNGCPDRHAMNRGMRPFLPGNMRHTFVTLAGECGEIVKYTGKGVDLSQIAQVVGHRPGSTMTKDRYDKLQVPPMIQLPLEFPTKKEKK